MVFIKSHNDDDKNQLWSLRKYGCTDDGGDTHSFERYLSL